MPLNSAQLAELVNRARHKAPPVISPPPPPQRSLRPRQTKPAPRAAPATQPSPESQRPAPAAVLPPLPAPPPEHTAEAEDFPIGWELKKESWHFHRRFYAVFRRPMAHGEYSHLLWQVRRGKAEPLAEGCWRVTLSNGRTLPVRATPRRLITILPKGWQPPGPASHQTVAASPPRETPYADASGASVAASSQR